MIQNSSNWILFTKLRQKVCGKNGSQFDDSAYASTVFKPHGFVDKRSEKDPVAIRRKLQGKTGKEHTWMGIPKIHSKTESRSPRFTRWIIGAKTSMRGRVQDARDVSQNLWDGGGFQRLFMFRCKQGIWIRNSVEKLKLHHNESVFAKMADGACVDPPVPSNQFKKLCNKTMKSEASAESVKNPKRLALILVERLKPNLWGHQAFTV